MFCLLSPSLKMADAKTNSVLESAELDVDAFVGLLEKLVGETPHLMNKPPTMIPKESLAGRHVLAVLEPYKIENGGPLVVREVAYQPDRGNIIIEYPGTGDKTCSFVGSHLDVVPANPEEWTRDPFKLIREGDLIYGRGTTDCLGHVSLLTNIFVQLATLKPKLSITVIGVLIVDEEVGGGEVQVGVDALMHHGELNKLKNGPVFWLDCADKQPNIGSGGLLQWSLKAFGKTFHSGFPHKAVNAIELANDALAYIQQRFYTDFPEHPKEKEYNFPCSSSMKPTAITAPDGSLNQIKGECTIQGDVRLIPFYKVQDVRKAVDSYVDELNKTKFSILHGRGPSKYTIADEKEPFAGRLEFKWLGPGVNGLACDLTSPGYKYLCEATLKHVGRLSPLADTGSLPLVAELQDSGYDVQTIGYGVEDAYHADNEFARISDYCQGFRVLMMIVHNLDSSS